LEHSIAVHFLAGLLVVFVYYLKIAAENGTKYLCAGATVDVEKNANFLRQFCVSNSVSFFSFDLKIM
jgi:hypothetical protein